MFRAGQWVLVDGQQIGVHVRGDHQASEVHLVNEAGETTSVLVAVDVARLTPAALEDIPGPRRPGNAVRLSTPVAATTAFIPARAGLARLLAWWRRG